MKFYTILAISFLWTISGCSTTPVTKKYSSKGLTKDFFPTSKGEKVQFLVFGDSGTGKKMQYKVAESMKKVCAAQGCDFGILLGDNFYEVGVSSQADEQFIEKFEKPYAPLGIRFYPSLGNHDHGYFGLGGNTQAQIEYTKRSKYWRMPHPYYNFRVADVELIAIDTNTLQNEDPLQLQWFQDTVQKSKAKWLIVYGHHPVYSYGSHGNNPELGEKILPQLCQKTDAFLAGHEHDLQLIQAECGFIQLISGAAGKLRTTSGGKNSLFHKSAFGFNRVEIAGDEMKIIFYNQDGQEIFNKTFANR